MTQRAVLASAVVLVALVAGSTLGAAGVPKDRDAIEHALNRLAYGPRPGDVEHVQQMGLATWIDQQLHPDGIDDSALKARLPEQPARPERFDDQMAARQWGRQSVQALSAEKVTRAVYSERQLEEVLVDFWFNHFNVFAGKGAVRVRSPPTSATRSGRTSSASSATCSARPPRARRCSSISTTG